MFVSINSNTRRYIMSTALVTVVVVPLSTVKEFGLKWVSNSVITDVTPTKPGSLLHLLHGPRPSTQSISIKMGKFGEEIAKAMIKSNPALELLRCGVQPIDAKNGKKKDIDLAWIDTQSKKLFIRELKGNIELDTEKLPATFKKITDDLMPFVQEKYPDYEINVGILNWSVYGRDELSAGLNHIKACERHGVCVDHWGDFCQLVQFEWSKEDYYEYMRSIGKMIDEMLAK